MFGMFRRYKDNPGQSDEPPSLEGEDPFGAMHGSLWRFLLHLDKRQAVTDERVLFILNRMLPVVLAIELLILGYLVGT